MSRGPATLLVPLALGACVQSVNPLATDGTLVSVPGLVGTWVATSGDVLVVTTTDSTTYGLTLLDQDGETSRWVGRVTSLRGRRWLDVVPADLPDQWSEEYRNSFLPLHQFWALRQADSLLVAAGLDYDSLRTVLERDPAAVAHATVADGVVLTADTPALRAFIAAFADRPGTLEDSDTLRRVSRTR
jgi:hypothetical protein